MKTLLLFYFLIVSFGAFSQDTTHHHKWKYFGLHQVGLLAGSSQNALGLLTTNGISKGNWFGGIGTGIDWYGTRSIPLLASVYKAFGQSRNQPFVYGSAGMSFGWAKDQANTYYSHNYKNGFASEAGLGYFIYLKNKTAITLSAGYSYKQVKAEEKYLRIVDFPPYNSDYITSTYKYNYRRIAIRLGIKI